MEFQKHLMLIIGKPRSGKTVKCIEYLKGTKPPNVVIFDQYGEYSGIFKDEVCITVSEFEIGMLDHPFHVIIKGDGFDDYSHPRDVEKHLDQVIALLETRKDESWLLVIDVMSFQYNYKKLGEYLSDETRDNMSLIMVYQNVEEVHEDIMKNATSLVDIKVEREEITKYNRIIKQYNGAEIERYSGISFTFNVYDEIGGRASLSCLHGNLFVAFNDVKITAYHWSGVVKGKAKYFLHELEDIAAEKQILLEIDYPYFYDYDVLAQEGYILLNRFNRSVHRFQPVWIKEGDNNDR